MITLKWVEAQIEETLAGANTAKNIYDLGMLCIVRDALTRRAAEPVQEAGTYAQASGPEEQSGDGPVVLRKADPYYGQAPYTHGVGTISEEDARMWVDSLIGADGTRGGRWSMEDVRSLAEKRGYTTEAEMVEFWVVINMLRADYGEVMKHYGVSSPDLYADMARAWINDPDAVEDKAGKYMEHVLG